MALVIGKSIVSFFAMCPEASSVRRRIGSFPWGEMISRPLLSTVIDTQEPSTAASEDLISSTLKPGRTVRFSAGVATFAAASAKWGRAKAVAIGIRFRNRAKEYVFISRMMHRVFVIRSMGASLLWAGLAGAVAIPRGVG